MEWKHDHYVISDDPARIDPVAVHRFLGTSYWAQDRDLETVRKSIENSLCFGAYLDGVQIGFARVVTDGCTMAFIADVIIDTEHRRRGLGKKIVAAIQAHPLVPGSIQVLKTKDAHGLYEQYGFVRSEFMVRKL